MKNDNTNTLLFALALGGVVGAGALYYFYTARHQKTPILKQIGKTLCNVGGMIENCNIDSGSDVAELIEKKLPKGADIVSSLGQWVESGLCLWNKLKKE